MWSSRPDGLRNAGRGERGSRQRHGAAGEPQGGRERRDGRERQSDLRLISPLQILGLERLEVRGRLRAVLVVEVMPDPVAECAAVDERDLQSEMQAHLRCSAEWARMRAERLAKQSCDLAPR